MITTRALDLSPDGLAHSAAMLRAAMPLAGHMSKDVLVWQYVTNPAGHALGLEAFDGDRLISHCVVQPLVARLGGRQVRGVMSMNAATLPQYLGRGIYFGLAAELYASVRTAGYSFGVAVTNDMSTPGFVRHCGFHVVRPLEARLGLGPIPAPSREARIDFEKVWDDSTIHWRLTPPHVRYRYETRRGCARVLAPTGRLGIEAVLGEVGAESIPAPTIPPRRTANPLRLWLGLDQRIDWRRSVYRNLPRRLRPSPLNLIFADLTGQGIRLDAQQVRWSGMDFDDF